MDNRFKIIHACPFRDTVVIDTDMLILNDLSNWQTHFEKYDFWICNNVKNRIVCICQVLPYPNINPKEKLYRHPQIICV